MRVLIAGASGGIGRYLTKKFDVLGNWLYLTYNTSQENVYTPKFAIYEKIQCDFTQERSVREAFNTIEYIDVLINVMGTVKNDPIRNMKEATWDWVIETNLKTVFLSCRFGYSRMTPNSHIINISSVLGSTGMRGASNYVASKGAVEAFTKSFALECIRDKIFVNAIALGYFTIGMGLQLDSKIENLVKDSIPLKEFGDPEEIYTLIQYIIHSTYLVGQVIHLNGGLRV